jgi:hypothetical protein
VKAGYSFQRFSILKSASSNNQPREVRRKKTHHQVRCEHRILEIVSVERDPEESGLRKETRILLDEIIDFVLRLEMRHVILAVSYPRTVWQSTPDVVLQSCRLSCSSCEINALRLFNLDGLFWSVCCKRLEEICFDP